MRHFMATLATLALCTGPARAEQPIHVTDEGLSLDLTPAGLGFVTAAARQELAGRLQNQQIGDLEWEVPFLWRIKAEGISYSVKLRDLTLAPTTDALDAAAIIEDVEVRIDNIRFESWLISEIGTSCRGSEIHVGNYNDLPAAARLGASLVDGRVALDVQSLDFTLNSEQYDSYGPTDCRGPYDIRDIFTQYVVSTVLEYARPAVELGVQFGVRAVVPRIGEALGEFAGARMPVALPNVAVLPATKMLLGFKPYALQITPEKIAMKLSLYMQRDDAESHALSNLAFAPAAPNSELLGRIGINPDALDALMAVTMPNGSLSTELHPEAHEFIALLTNRADMASILPDLTEAPLESDRLRLFVRFVVPPRFALDDAGRLKVDIPQMEWRYQVLQDGQWLDYFLLSLQSNLAIVPTSAEGKIQLKVTSGAITVDGNWAPGYTPRNPRFERETAQAFFGALVQILAEADQPVAIAIPALAVGGRTLTIDGLSIDAPFLSLDLFAAQR